MDCMKSRTGLTAAKTRGLRAQNMPIGMPSVIDTMAAAPSSEIVVIAFSQKPITPR